MDAQGPLCFYLLKVWKCLLFSHVQLFATPRTVAQDSPLSTEFSRQEYWSGPFPSPEDPPDLGMKLKSPESQADSLLSEPPGKFPRRLLNNSNVINKKFEV